MLAYLSMYLSDGDVAQTRVVKIWHGLLDAAATSFSEPASDPTKLFLVLERLTELIKSYDTLRSEATARAASSSSTTAGFQLHPKNGELDTLLDTLFQDIFAQAATSQAVGVAKLILANPGMPYFAFESSVLMKNIAQHHSFPLKD